MIKRTIVLTIAASLMLSNAYPHDHARPDLNQWYKSLTNQRKGSCCDGSSSEVIHLKDVDWDTQNKPDSHYRVRVPATSMTDTTLIWVDVPDDMVVDGPNEDGSTLVWPIYGYIGVSIRCFLAGSMG